MSVEKRVTVEAVEARIDGREDGKTKYGNPYFPRSLPAHLAFTPWPATPTTHDRVMTGKKVQENYMLELSSIG